MTERRGNTKSRIPEFASYAEEAEFWDSHDTTDFEEEFKPVKVRFAGNLSDNLNVRLDAQELERLKQYARAKGVAPATLVRAWIREHLPAAGAGQS